MDGRLLAHSSRGKRPDDITWRLTATELGVFRVDLFDLRQAAVRMINGADELRIHRFIEKPENPFRGSEFGHGSAVECGSARGQT